MSEPKYIVTKRQIISTIESALELSFNSPSIIKELMKDIENNVETVLEDDCEEYEDNE